MHPDLYGWVWRSIIFIVTVVPLLDTPGLKAQQGPGSAPIPSAMAMLANIRGKVVAADSGRGLRRAKIVLVSTKDASRRLDAFTGVDGTFAVSSIEPGSYRLMVTRSGFLTYDAGQQAAGDVPSFVELAAGQTVDNLTIRLQRASVIAGRVVDEVGEAVEGASVFAMRSQFFEGRRQFVPFSAGTLRTDEFGEFRVGRLSPGSYLVLVTSSDTWTVTEGPRESKWAFAPTFAPGVPSEGEASQVSLRSGERVDVGDVALIPARTASVCGTAFDSHGMPLPRVELTQEIKGHKFASYQSNATASVGPDGLFCFKDLRPARFTIVGRTVTDKSPEVAIEHIDLQPGVDQTVRVVTSTGGQVKGRLRNVGDMPFDYTRAHISAIEPFRVQPHPALIGAFGNDMSAQSVAENGAFVINHVFGKARLDVRLPDGWMVESVTRDGKDLDGEIIELASGEDITDIEVLVSNDVHTVSGVAVSNQGVPSATAAVILFSEQQSKWYEGSRMVQLVRTNSAGRWTVKGLPRGKYLAAALAHVDQSDWMDPVLFETLRPRAVEIQIADKGGSRDVRLVILER